MSASELIDDIRQAGGTVDLDGDELVVKAPPGYLDQQRRAVLVANKAAIIHHLRQQRETFVPFFFYPQTGETRVMSPDEIEVEDQFWQGIDERDRQAAAELQAEREAIQWVETLDDRQQADGTATATAATAEIDDEEVCPSCKQFHDGTCERGLLGMRQTKAAGRQGHPPQGGIRSFRRDQEDRDRNPPFPRSKPGG